VAGGGVEVVAEVAVVVEVEVVAVVERRLAEVEGYMEVVHGSG
jgi:hypothetical protein